MGWNLSWVFVWVKLETSPFFGTPSLQAPSQKKQKLQNNWKAYNPHLDTSLGNLMVPSFRTGFLHLINLCQKKHAGDDRQCPILYSPSRFGIFTSALSRTSRDTVKSRPHSAATCSGLYNFSPFTCQNRATKPTLKNGVYDPRTHRQLQNPSSDLKSSNLEHRNLRPWFK